MISSRTASQKAHHLTISAIFLALTLALSYLEHLIPALPFMPPGVKLGLSNIIVMYCLLVQGSPSALLIAFLKSGFVFLTRGTIAGTLSLLGGGSSVLVMFLLSRIKKPRLSVLTLSLMGAVFHNLGQLLGVMLLISRYISVYLPVLIASGTLMGLITGSILRIVMPALKKLSLLPDRKRTLSLFLAVLLLFTSSSLSGCSLSASIKGKHSTSFTDLFDTYSTLTVYDITEEQFQVISRKLHDSLLVFHQETDIYHSYEGITNLCDLNAHAGAGPLEVSPQLFDFLAFCQEACSLSYETVNVMIGPVTSLWHQAREDRILPSEEALAKASAHTQIQLLVLNFQTSSAEITDPLGSIDVGALAKGYAGRMAMKLLYELDVENYLLDLGGNIVTAGKPIGTGRDYFVIGIQDPEKPYGTYASTVSIQNRCAVTSGDYQRTVDIDGIMYHHIIDPLTLYPGTLHHAVTVVHEDPALCDMLSTALFLMSEEEGKALASSFRADCYYD